MAPKASKSLQKSGLTLEDLPGPYYFDAKLLPTVPSFFEGRSGWELELKDRQTGRAWSRKFKSKASLADMCDVVVKIADFVLSHQHVWMQLDGWMHLVRMGTIPDMELSTVKSVLKRSFPEEPSSQNVAESSDPGSTATSCKRKRS